MSEIDHRQLGVDLFNRAWTLLDLPERTPEQEDELVHAVHASRHHWAQVGQPRHLARGDWQISRAYAVLGRPEPALHHARRCLAILEGSGDGEDWDVPFAHEALARAHLAAGDRAAAGEHLARARELGAGIADPEDREHLESSLAELAGALEPRPLPVVNLHGDEWTRVEERDGWRSRDLWVGHRLGAELVGGSLYELEPGSRLWPYHVHHANEEWLLVVRGRPTLRSPGGEQGLREGDVVCFPRGAAGAHQVRNDTGEPVRVLMLSSEVYPEILEYPDSGKVATVGAKGERLGRFRPGPELDYWDGED